MTVVHPLWLRRIVVAVDAFVAVTAVGGGLALASGAERGRFPVQWLSRTPWTSYLIPGLILALAVGGSATLATVAAWRRLRSAGRVTAVAGIVLAGQVVGEIALLAQPKAPTSAEVFYLFVAAGMLASGVLLQRSRVPEPGPAERTAAGRRLGPARGVADPP